MRNGSLHIRLFLSVALLLLSGGLWAENADIPRHKDGTRIYADSAIYQGMSLKADLGNTILELATSKAKVQSYEIAMNWRIIQRLYPAWNWAMLWQTPKPKAASTMVKADLHVWDWILTD